jgi:lipopolysaccharide export system permease protein
MLLATLFTAGRMINSNEIIAVKNAGVNLLRFMLPFLYVGAVLTAFSLYFNNWLVPEANKNKFYIERNYLGKYRTTASLNKLYFQDYKNQLIIIEQFLETELTANKVSILLYRQDQPTIMQKRIDAEKMIWEGNNWVLINGVERDFTNQDENLRTYPRISANEIEGIRKLNLTPSLITKKLLKPDEMNYSELKEFMDTQLKGGQNIDKTLVDFYSKISFPFSNLIVIIFGISISTGSGKRKGLALQFGISILVSFIYLGFVKISQTFGYNGDLNPLLTAWLANIAFAVFGGVNLYARNY